MVDYCLPTQTHSHSTIPPQGSGLRSHSTLDEDWLSIWRRKERERGKNPRLGGSTSTTMRTMYIAHLYGCICIVVHGPRRGWDEMSFELELVSQPTPVSVSVSVSESVPNSTHDTNIFWCRKIWHRHRQRGFEVLEIFFNFKSYFICIFFFQKVAKKKRFWCRCRCWLPFRDWDRHHYFWCQKNWHRHRHLPFLVSIFRHRHRHCHRYFWCQ